MSGADTAGAGQALTRPFPARSRILVLSALLLLSAYTVFAGLRIHQGADRVTESSALKPAVDAAAGRLNARAAPLKSAAEAAAHLLSKSRDTEPLEAAELALKLAGPGALGAAVVRDGEVIGAAGQGARFHWLDAVRGQASTITQMGLARSGDASLYTVTPAGDAARPTYLVIASDLSLFSADLAGAPLRSGVSRLLVQHDGLVVSPRAAKGPNTLDGLVGLDLSRIKADVAAGGETAVVNPDHHRTRLSAAPVGATGLFVIDTTPADLLATEERRALAADTVSLLAPLVVGIILALVVFRQARKAELEQQQRSDSERKFRNAVEAAHCGIWEWRIRDDMVFLSDVTGVMFGWGGGGVAQGQEVLARIAPEHRERVRLALADAAEHGAFDVTFKVPGPDGPAWIDARGQGFGERDELGYSAILGVALDVTQERLAQARVISAEERLNDAIESVSEAFVLWDRRGRLIMSNRNYQEFFNLEARLLKPGVRRDMIQKVAEVAVRAHQPAPDGRPGVREAEMLDGRWLQISERRTSDGGLVMTAADITAVKRQEEARRRNEQALQRAVIRLEESGAEMAELAYKYEQEKIRAQQANAAKSEFLANMSHELRTPLNAINGFSEMMSMEMLGPLGDARYKEYAHDILGSGQHLLAVINDILDMAKIEAGKHSLNLEAVDLRSVAEDATRLMRNRAEAGGLTLSVEMGDLPIVEADPRAVKQVLLNLLSNAVKFTPRGGQVKIAARRVSDRVRISVMDTGIGIAKNDLARLARPFEQVESQLAKTQQGTGLGLALSKSLVEMHEGRLELISEPGRGTTVSFVLPIQQRHAPDRASASDLAAATTPSLARAKA